VVGLTRSRVIAFSIAAAATLVVVGALVQPQPHEVHTPGGEPLIVRSVNSTNALYYNQTIKPSQSLDDIRCGLWHLRNPITSPCPDSAELAGLYFTNLSQSQNTLYVPWQECWGTPDGPGGFDVEYQPSRQALVIHCYVAKPWYWTEPRIMGVEAAPPAGLLLIPTGGIQNGSLSVIEDDRIEHLLGDDSTEFQLGIATIS
jgi:hypothetical protein